MKTVRLTSGSSAGPGGCPAPVCGCPAPDPWRLCPAARTLCRAGRSFDAAGPPAWSGTGEQKQRKTKTRLHLGFISVLAKPLCSILN